MNVCIRSLEFLTELIVWGVKKKTTSRLFNLHPSQASPSPPPPLACKRNIFRPHVACKRNIFRPHVPCSPPSDSFKESISSSANLLKVKNSRKFAIPIFDLDKYKVWGRNGYFGKCSVCPFKVMPLLEEMFSHPRQTLSSDHRQITITSHLTCLPISSLSSHL